MEALRTDTLLSEAFTKTPFQLCQMKGKKSLLRHTVKRSVRISEVDFLQESVDWVRNKCLLSQLTGLGIMKVQCAEDEVYNRLLRSTLTGIHG